jgi:ATP-dependent Clp protease protease subunit
MTVIEKSSSGITQISADAKLMSQRKVFIEGEITAETACEFVKKIMILNIQDMNRPIDLFINTPGGCINSGMLYYDVIQASKAPIRTFCIGRAYSMGAVLLACGNHGRYILPHGEVMIHEPLLGNRVGGNSSSIKSISESLLETKRKMNQILAKHTGQSEEAVEKATSYDHYFDAEESLQFGLVDEIVDFGKLMEEC